MKLTELVETVDNFELIRDQVAAILVDEITGQKSLATAASKDKRLFDLAVFTERSNPWAEWTENPDQNDATPIVNVWFDKDNVVESASNQVARQRYRATYNLDCYGYGVSVETPGSGHQPGDQGASLEAHRAARLVRQILMAGTYTYLDMRGVVGGRLIESRTTFQPIEDQRPVPHVQAMRLSLRVDFNEFSPQTDGEALELLALTLKRTETGQVLLDQTFDYT